MQIIDIESLKNYLTAPEDLFLNRGQKIVDAGQKLSEKVIRLLQQSGIIELVAVPLNEQEKFKFDAINTAISLESNALQKEGTLSQSLYDQQGNLILRSGETWTKKLANRLKEKQISTLYLRKSDEQITQDEEKSQLLRQLLYEIWQEENSEIFNYVRIVEEIPEDYQRASEDTFTTEGVDQLSLRLGNDVIPDVNQALSHEVADRNPYQARTENEKDRLRLFQKNSLYRLKNLCHKLLIGRSGKTEDAIRVSKEMLSAFLIDSDLLLMTCHLHDTRINEDFILRHNINRSIYTIQIASMMGYSAQQVFELSFGSLLHDIGMLKIPRKILLKPGPLTAAEKDEVFKHPSYSLSMLQNLPGVPLSTPLIAYQCHERGDRSGYPQRKRLKIINKFSRIAMLADIYCALVSPRPHRGAYTPDKAMEFLAREASEGRVDNKIFDIFLQVNSLYPIGTWVVLNDGHIGRVISTNVGKVDRPIIRTFFRDQKPLESLGTIDLADILDVKINKTFDGNRLNIDTLVGA